MISSGDATAELPRYKCYKEVHALKIRHIDAADALELLQTKAREARISLEHGEWDDAKEALNDILRWSPTKAFEEGHTPI